MVASTRQYEIPVDGSALVEMHGGLGARHQVTDDLDLRRAQLAQPIASFRGHTVRYARTRCGYRELNMSPSARMGAFRSGIVTAPVSSAVADASTRERGSRGS